MRQLRCTIFTATTVVVLLAVFLILFFFRDSVGIDIFFLIGSIQAILIFVTILLWLLVQRNFLDGPDILGIRRFRVILVAVPLLTVALLAIVIILRFFLQPTWIVFSVCAGADLVLILGIIWPVLLPKLIAQSRERTQTRLEFSNEEANTPELEFSYLRRVGGLPKKFRYEDLMAATNNFQNPIGRGGSGSVFMGVLGDGLPVAVKRIEGELHGEREFRSEITAIVSAQHVNLVTILGYCLVPGGYRFLVYEFIRNGSLDSWIFPRRGGEESYLTWAVRYQVSIDVAKALAFLHHDCRSRILHLDVKPQNILLDENFKARVSDFGISRMMGKDESRVITTIRGTRGYLAPEWFSIEGVSYKSDVYSYGMVLLELIGGRRNCEFIDNGNISERTWFYFPKIVSEKMREGKLMDVVDERLMKDGGVDEAEVRVLVYVALWCIQERAELRPSMELVVSMLKGHVPVDMPPETRMFMVDLVVPIDSDTGHASGLSTTHSSTASADCRPMQDIGTGSCYLSL